MAKLDDDFCPVTGGVDLPKSRFRDDMDQLSRRGRRFRSRRHIVQLLALHPKLRVRFRNQDLAALDDADEEGVADGHE